MNPTPTIHHCVRHGDVTSPPGWLSGCSDCQIGLWAAEIVVPVAGALFANLSFNVLRWSCGTIRDGISVRSQPKGSKCGFDIAFEDLERVYLAAKAYRERGALPRDGAEGPPDYTIGPAVADPELRASYWQGR